MRYFSKECFVGVLEACGITLKKLGCGVVTDERRRLLRTDETRRSIVYISTAVCIFRVVMAIVFIFGGWLCWLRGEEDANG